VPESAAESVLESVYQSYARRSVARMGKERSHAEHRLSCLKTLADFLNGH